MDHAGPRSGIVGSVKVITMEEDTPEWKEHEVGWVYIRMG